MSEAKSVGQYRNAYFRMPEAANYSNNYTIPWEFLTSHGEYDFYINKTRKVVGVQYGPYTGQYWHVDKKDAEKMLDSNLRALILAIGMTILVW